MRRLACAVTKAVARRFYKSLSDPSLKLMLPEQVPSAAFSFEAAALELVANRDAQRSKTNSQSFGNYASKPRRQIWFWQRVLVAETWITEMILSGARHPWSAEKLREAGLASPADARADQANDPSCLQHAAWMDSAIGEWVQNRALKRVLEKPQIICRLTLATKHMLPGETEQRFRLCFDGRPLNELLDTALCAQYPEPPRKFRFERLSEFIAKLSPGDLLWSWDLSSGYEHIGIASEDQQFLGVRWRDPKTGREAFYQFAALPFGVGYAPYMFSRFTQCVVRFWRSLGMVVHHIMDDFGGATSHGVEAGLVDIVVQGWTLLRAGLTISWKKFHQLSHHMQLVGTILDTATLPFGRMIVPFSRVQRTRVIARALLNERADASLRDIARVCGLILSMKPVIGADAFMLCTELWDLLPRRQRGEAGLLEHISALKRRWLGRSRLSATTVTTLRAILEYFEGNDSPAGDLFPLAGPRPLHIVAAGDASETAAASSEIASNGWHSLSTIVNPLGDKRLTRHSIALFGPDVIETSSTRREVRVALLRVRSSLEDRAPFIGPGRGIFLCLTDSQSFTKGARKGNFRDRATQRDFNECRALCAAKNLIFEVAWRRRDALQAWDDASKYVDTSDYQLPADVGRQLVTEHALEVDRFAAEHSRAGGLPYNSLLGGEGSRGNAFAQHWGGERCLLFPPTHLIPEVVAKARHEGASGVLVVPAWPAKSLPGSELLFGPDGLLRPAFTKVGSIAGARLSRRQRLFDKIARRGIPRSAVDFLAFDFRAVAREGRSARDALASRSRIWQTRLRTNDAAFADVLSAGPPPTAWWQALGCHRRGGGGKGVLAVSAAKPGKPVLRRRPRQNPFFPRLRCGGSRGLATRPWAGVPQTARRRKPGVRLQSGLPDARARGKSISRAAALTGRGAKVERQEVHRGTGNAFSCDLVNEAPSAYEPGAGDGPHLFEGGSESSIRSEQEFSTGE